MKKFLFSPADYGGCGHYRVIQRATIWNTFVVKDINKNAPDAIMATHYLSAEELKDHNIKKVLTQRQYEDKQIVALNRYKNHQLPILMDWDDLLWNVPAKNPFKKVIDAKKIDNLRQCTQIADLNIVSTDPLREELRKFSGVDSIVLPNFLSPDWYVDAPKARKDGEPFTVIWAGSSTHDGDLALVKSVINNMKDVKFIIFGYKPQGFNYPNVTFIPGVEFGRYPTMLKAIGTVGVHAAIAPLESHPFNDCKSNLKLLEYGALGLPVVSSNAYPYKDNDSDMVIDNRKNNVAKWINALRSLQHDEVYRMNKAKQSLNYAKQFDASSVNNIIQVYDALTRYAASPAVQGGEG